MTRLPSLGVAIALAVVVLDQASKWWIVSEVMSPPRVIEVAPFFNVVLVMNRGASFGLAAAGGAVAKWGLAALAVIIAGALVVWLWRNRRIWVAAALGLVIGGAAGNLADRLRLGAVVDFLDFHLAGQHWPAFNLADSAITVGVGILLVDALIGRQGRT